MKTKLVRFTPLEGKLLLELLDGRAPRYIQEKLPLTDAAYRVHISHMRSKLRGGWSYNTEEPKEPLPITPSQRKVLELRAAGKTHMEIAKALGISYLTSYAHASAGMKRLHVDCRKGYNLVPLRKALAALEGGETV